jgi:adenylyltransferase/sulfurtransferase
MVLPPGERARYERQIGIEDVGEAGQERLGRATVMVAGAGGLGSSAATYLAAAGCGTLRLVDHDRVEPGNLNRQVLHWEEDVGARKVDSAVAKLRRLNPGISVEPHARTLDEGSAAGLVGGCDVVVDALDDLDTRLVLNEACVRAGIPLVHGAVHGFEGRVLTVLPGRTACLACLVRGSFPHGAPPVIGVAPAVIGSLQATEAIKVVLGIGEPLGGRLVRFDGLSLTFTTFRVKRDAGCATCAST